MECSGSRQEHVKERIRKVFARCVSPFEGEARTAANMARQMMNQYSFTVDELGLGKNGVWQEWVNAARYFWEDFDATDIDLEDEKGLVVPMNWATKKHYQGANIDRLRNAGFRSAYWMGFHQAKKLGGHVRKGQKGTKIIRWDVREVVNPDTGETEKRYRRIVLTVFNAEQIDGINFC